MRNLEIALILINAATLLLAFKKQPKAVWLVAAAVNLAVFAVHGLIEGLRYQMGFSYLFAVLLAVVALLKTNDRLSVRQTPTFLKITATGLSILLLALTALLAHALPVFELPQPSGSDAVGVEYVHLIDEARSDPFLDQSSQKREIMVKIYYPAQADGVSPRVPYFQGSPDLIRSFASFYGLPDFSFDHLNLVRAHARADGQLSERQPRYPVVLFSHGAGTTLEVQTAQSEDLASHGYIVVAIDHTYVSSATRFPSRIVSHKEATAEFSNADPAALITRIMADDAKFVLDTLARMNEGEIRSIFEGRLDLDNIGAIGHSVGGAVAYHLAIDEPRVKAAINLDGAVYVAPEEGAQAMAPFLMLADDFHVQEIQNRHVLMPNLEEVSAEEAARLLVNYGSRDAYVAAYRQAQQNILGLIEVLKESGTLFTIEGSAHMGFTDLGLFIGDGWLRQRMGISGQTDPVRCLEITKAVTVAFFDQHLRGESRGALDSLVDQYAELKRVALP